MRFSAALLLVAPTLALPATTFNLAFNWKFELGESPDLQCSDDLFPTLLDNLQCNGLSSVPYAADDRDACELACCSLATCRVWQFCDGVGDCGPTSCWIGDNHMEDCKNVESGWISRGRASVPPPPSPASECDTAVSPECAPDFDDSLWRSVDLPHDFVVEGTVDKHLGDPSHGFLPVGLGWYRKQFPLDATYEGSLAYLTFEGAMGAVELYVNGIFIAAKDAGYTPFSYEISSSLKYGDGASNVIAVKCDGHLTDSWWYDGGGLYRTASLAFKPDIFLATNGVYAPALVKSDIISETSTSPATAECSIPATVEIECHADDCTSSVYRLSYSVTEKATGAKVTSGSVAAPITSSLSTVSMPIALPGQTNLWSIAHPSLYTLETSLSVGDAVSDISSITFGCRKAAFDVNKGFFLNDVPTKILGVANHQDLPGFGAAVPDSLQRHRVERMQAFGANAWRTAHNCPNTALLDATDEMGMLVWDENHKNGQTDEAVALVRRDRNHPSVIIWSICNEVLCDAGDGLNGPISMKSAQDIIDVYHDMDFAMGRPVSANNNAWNQNGTFLDLVGIDYCTDDIDSTHVLVPDRPIIKSETSSAFGDRGEYSNDYDNGIVRGYDTEYPSWGFTAEGAWGGIGVKDNQGILTRDFVAGGFTWTGWDYKGEPTPTSWPSVTSHFGIIDTSGFDKDRTFWYRAWWQRDVDMLYVFPHWNWEEEGQDVEVWCYTNFAEVELFINGASQGRRAVGEFNHAAWDVKYAKGELTVKGYRHVGDAEEADVSSVKTTGVGVKLEVSVMHGVGEAGISNDGLEFGKVQVQLVDADGYAVPMHDAIDVAFTVSEGGRVIGTGAGNNVDHVSDVSNVRGLYHGKAMGWVGIEKGCDSQAITVTVVADGIEGGEVEFTVVQSVVGGIKEL
jgi:beta-galactosidase